MVDGNKKNNEPNGTTGFMLKSAKSIVAKLKNSFTA